MDIAIQRVGIVSKPEILKAEQVLPPLMDWLARRGVEAKIDLETARYLNRTDGLTKEQAVQNVDLVIVLGGDGTLLSVARAMKGQDTPVFPVNLGSLGFLTAIKADELFPQLERAFQGEHRVGQRRLLKCSLRRNGRCISTYQALNDAVITKQSLARMIDCAVYLNDQYVSEFKADGLIISTATGSTAYSLSAGGPIIMPSVAALVISPICPHTLTHRPVVVPDTSVVRTVNLSEDGSSYLTIDGQVGEELCLGDEIICESSPHWVRLVRPPQMRFFDVLREKLKWGQR